MADKQQGFDIVTGIFPAVLVQDPCIPGQAHGGQAVILSDDDIPGADPVYQGKIHTVGSLVENHRFRASAVEFMGGIAQDQTGNSQLGSQPDGNVHHGTAVSINENFHAFTSQ